MKTGSLGVWFATNALNADELTELATNVETLGYEALWYPESLAYESLSLAGFLLARTSRLKLASGIANIYARDPLTAAAGHDGLNRLYGGRFVMGLGVSHKPIVEGARRHSYGSPLAEMRGYLEGMAGAPLQEGFALPAGERNVVLAALGPKMLQLARDETRGALPYNVTPEHTAMAREALGKAPWLCVEQKICLTADKATARRVAAQHMKRYMPLPNYRNNWLRLGFSEEELSGEGSPRFLDAMVAWGGETQIRERIEAHFRAGASHVCIQPLDPGGTLLPDRGALKAFAPG
ncbi:MAG TPA: TIGR03620 family F420-dependent LLM class oxidoreductase [Alphaproteobacteria bacterium]|jgi:probable F420-dependent oxidoreductase|nr:TIGR03620 family F420-dependent LLM class oxidoreductase [Alphaproteobacteria bacterium]